MERRHKDMLDESQIPLDPRSDLRVLVTSVGAPNFKGAWQSLKRNGERYLTLIGIDQNPDAWGKSFCDHFAVAPAGDDPVYLPWIYEFVKQQKIDVVLPLSTMENLALSRFIRTAIFPCKVIVSDWPYPRRASNKLRFYETCKNIGFDMGISVPEMIMCDPPMVVSACTKLGYPEKKLCVKPICGEGSRGFRILDCDADVFFNILRQKK